MVGNLFLKMARLPPGKNFHKNIYVDQISGGEIESIVLRDREKLSKEGVVIVIAEIDTETGQAIDLPTVVTEDYPCKENRIANKTVAADVKNVFSGKKSKGNRLDLYKKKVGEAAERSIFKNLKRRPLVLPVVIEE